MAERDQRPNGHALLIDVTSSVLQLPRCHSYCTTITGNELESTAAARAVHDSLRQPARTGPFGQSCLSALDRWKKPGLKAMVNQEILTIQLEAQLKLSALLQPMFSSGTV